MKHVVNRALATRRRRQATLTSLGGIAILLVGLYLNFQPGHLLVLYAYMALIMGSLLSFLGMSLADQWVRPPHAEDALGEAMKGAGPAYGLYDWALPADHVLVAPWGLTVMRVYSHEGPVVIRGDRWQDARPLTRKLLSLGRQPVRNPARILKIEADQLRQALVAQDPTLADVPMQPLAVFTHSRLELTVDAPNLPALRVDGLRDWLRAESSRPSLSPAQRRGLDAALTRLAETALGPSAAPKPATKSTKSAEAPKTGLPSRPAPNPEAKAAAQARARERAAKGNKAGKGQS